MPAMKGSCLRSALIAIDFWRRAAGSFSPTGSLKRGVRMLLHKDFDGSEGSTGRGIAISMVHLQLRRCLLSAWHSGSFNSWAQYLRMAPDKALMMASLTVQPCFARTSLTSGMGTGVILVKVCLPLYARNGLRSRCGGLILMSLSYGTMRRESAPLQPVHIRFGQPKIAEHILDRIPGRSPVLSLLLPKRIAGNGILSRTSPSSHCIIGKKENSKPKPSPMQW
mmetsp:Transcript_65083/g.121281  ORF Transcript_65083/g.121281 Transcript_65083/m.121281 type:complete len:223 (+) Transcript_65083:433-1101(+)